MSSERSYKIVVDGLVRLEYQEPERNRSLVRLRPYDGPSENDILLKRKEFLREPENSGAIS